MQDQDSSMDPISTHVRSSSCLAISLQRFYKQACSETAFRIGFHPVLFPGVLAWLADVSMASQSTEGPSSHSFSIVRWGRLFSQAQSQPWIGYTNPLASNWESNQTFSWDAGHPDWESGSGVAYLRSGPETELFAVPGWNPGTEPRWLPFESRHQREKQASHWHICAVLRTQ